MGKDIAKYILIDQINDKYNRCLKIADNGDIQAMNDHKKEIIFEIIEELYKVFCKYFRLEFKKRILPKQLFLLAKNEGYNNLADMWLDYIDDYNQYEFEKDDVKQKRFAHLMVKKYFQKLPLVKDFLNLPPIEKILDKYKDSHTNFKFNFNKSEYSKELGIDKGTYLTIIDYLKTVPVMNAWIYKEDFSDILYLIIDCSLEIWKIVSADLNRLDIPCYIEIINIYEQKNNSFVFNTMNNGTVHIYNMDNNKLPEFDFAYIHWQDYYKDVFLKKYSEIQNLAAKIKDNENLEIFSIMNQIEDFYTSTYLLIKYYLGNKGLFVKNATDTLRNAFRVGFLEDGETWIEFDYMMYKYKVHKTNILPIINFILRENFDLFERLNNKFKSLLEEND